MSTEARTLPRVVLVDDHGLFRSGVRAEIGRQVEVVGEADDVGPAIDVIGRLVPDVVLLDVHLPGGGGQGGDRQRGQVVGGRRDLGVRRGGAG